MKRSQGKKLKKFDPTTLEIYRALYTSVAEEMGIALRRTAFSPNIKERRDYSCAVFDATGQVIAQGDHMPVHLGSMPMAVAAALREIELAPGDVVALNDPFAGGTHLPDVTLVMSVVSGQLSVVTKNTRRSSEQRRGASRRTTNNKQRALFYVANRAHHARISIDSEDWGTEWWSGMDSNSWYRFLDWADDSLQATFATMRRVETAKGLLANGVGSSGPLQQLR